MDNTTIKNIETLLSDKLQNYMSDFLKTMATPGTVEVTETVTMEQADVDQHEEKSGKQGEQSNVESKNKGVRQDASTVVREKDQAKLYENFLKDGGQKSGLNKEKLMMILEDIHMAAKKSSDHSGIQQVQTMPVVQQEFEDRKDIDFKEEDLFEEFEEECFEEEGEEDDDEHDDDDDHEEEDGTMTLKELKNLYLKI